MLMRYIAVREDHQVYSMLADQLDELLLRLDGDPFRVELARQPGRISSILDLGDLRCGERYHFVLRVIAEIDVEVMEITSGGA
jgi:hypothetical protein